MSSATSSANTNKRNQNAKKEIQLSEPERQQLQKYVLAFIDSGEEVVQLRNLTNAQRKYVHKIAARQSLKTRSTGSDGDRVLHLSHRKRRDLGATHELELTTETSRLLAELSQTARWQLNATEKLLRQSEHHHQQHKNFNGKYNNRYRGDLLFGLRNTQRGHVPQKSNLISGSMLRDKEELPIFRYQDEILNMIKNHSIFIINGDTGCGKTTQVPQYILNDAHRHNRPCMVVVSEPRRIAAVASAKRVAEERGEALGDSVGYQIRMERRLGSNTNAIFTTSGCLLRAIMADVQQLCYKVTHLLIDEIHERDKYTDFALIAIKEQLKLNRGLKVILMSATMDIKQLSAYFDNCPIMNVPGQGYDVKIYHLEDILYHTGYRTALMEKYLRSINDMQQQLQHQAVAPQPHLLQQQQQQQQSQIAHPVTVADEYLQETLDTLLDSFSDPMPQRTEEEWCEYFDQIQYYVDSEDVPVDVGHTRTGLTPLMAACKCNCPKYVQIFAMRDAKLQLRDALGYTAADYAQTHSDGTCLSVLTQYGDTQTHMQSVLCRAAAEERERLLTAYHQQFNDDNEVDHDLILSLVEGLYRSSHPGAIMVFLPGYNDIVQQRDLITSTLPRDTYEICILHGQMDTHVQCAALQPDYDGVRKVILATNIAQTSITIPHLSYIIDSGKVKMKTYDVITESSQLQSVWISQADANQRAGRAGRTQNGVCYRLYSQHKFQSMSLFFIPEFMRIPLTEICLYAKTLDENCDVQSYLARSLNPPSTLSIQNAVRKLQLLDIFTADERVTPLGKQLVELPLDVQLGKCLLYGIFYGCVDPVLTIVAFHSVKDPFILPADRAAQGQSSFQRKSFAGQSYSDQMGILRLYEEYTLVRRNAKRVREFCNKNFLSQTAMEIFVATRCQLADQLTHRYRLNVKSFNNDWQMVRLCLVAGFYPNVAWIDRMKSTLVAGAEKQLVLHRTSALNPPGMKKLKDFIAKLPHDWVVYYEKSRMGSACSINMNSLVPAILVLLQCGLNCELSSIDDDDDDDDDEDDDGVAANNANSPVTPLSAGSTENISNCADMLQRLNVGDDATQRANGQQHRANTTKLLSLDNWIKFTSNSPNDVEHLMLMRKLIQRQFLAFLRFGQRPETTTAANCIQKLLAVATASSATATTATAFNA